MKGSPPTCCIVQRNLRATSETFISAHADRLPAVVEVIHLEDGLPAIAGTPVLSDRFLGRVLRRAGRTIRRETWGSGEAYSKVFRRHRPQVVLAESGPIGVLAMEACERQGIPLVVHFHGSDATDTRCLARHRESYPKMFEQAKAVVAVSAAMARQLEHLGCPPPKIIYNPYGVDCDELVQADPANAAPVFLCVGRMVEKKAPFLSLLAFAQACETVSARLRVIGDGDLLGPCLDLATGLGINHSVTFLGRQDHASVLKEMQSARGFVQHSVTASTGDCEGTPVAILEAGAVGLPVIATRHAGIPDVVLENETGLLCDERDVESMAANIRALATDPLRANELGQRASQHIREAYSMEQSIARLARILNAAAAGTSLKGVRSKNYAELPNAQRLSSIIQ